MGEAPEGLSNTGDATFARSGPRRGCLRSPFPRGVGRAELPLGLQVVGRYRDDESALRVAAWVESVLAFRPGLAG